MLCFICISTVFVCCWLALGSGAREAGARAAGGKGRGQRTGPAERGLNKKEKKKSLAILSAEWHLLVFHPQSIQHSISEITTKQDEREHTHIARSVDLEAYQ